MYDVEVMAEQWLAEQEAMAECLAEMYKDLILAHCLFNSKKNFIFF